MSVPMNPWMKHVHDTTLKEGKTLKLSDMLARFGNPKGQRLATQRLFSATRGGYFKKTGSGVGATYEPLPKQDVEMSGNWPSEKKELLRRVYPEMGGACLSMFPGITRKQLYAAANRLKLKAPKPKKITPKQKPRPKARPAIITRAPSSIFELAARMAA